MSQAVLEILDRIRHLPAEDRMVLDEQLMQFAESQWGSTTKIRWPSTGQPQRSAARCWKLYYYLTGQVTGKNSALQLNYGMGQRRT